MKMNEIARMIDISAVQANSSACEIKKMCDAAREFGFVAVFAMPWYTENVVNMLKDRPDIHVGGVVGFPSGADDTDVKIYSARKFRQIGCQEIDIVMNIGQLKSGMYDGVRCELAELRQATDGAIMKVIIEAPLLTLEETQIATDLVADCGADFVKSGTGWHGATELDKIRAMCDTARGRCAVKAAGGIRSREILETLVDMGVTRFGIGLNSSLNIMKEYMQLEQGVRA